MLGQRKHAFLRAHGLLRSIEADRDDFESLKALQMLLVDEIMLAERRVRELKAEAASLPLGAAPRKLTSLKRRIGEAQSLIFLWKCFGDGIAFIYVDKYSLKHTYLQATNNNAKLKPGFLIDKSGFEIEWRWLESALSYRVPAVLTDLTNTIRHGDLCLLGASDPCLIEVKSSKTKSRRTDRQKKDLKILREFFETDYSEILRGMGPVYREALPVAEVSYCALLNATIGQAFIEGSGLANPEKGLFYVAVKSTESSTGEIFAKLDLDPSWIFSWNAIRADRAWAPYYPFSLTIRDFEHLWAFVRGDIQLYTFVGTRDLEEIGSSNGNICKFDADEAHYPLSIKLKAGGSMRIAEQNLGRIGLECVSPAWLITSSLDTWKRSADRVENDNISQEIMHVSELDPQLRKYAEEAGYEYVIKPFV